MKQRNFFYGLIIFGLSFLILTVLLFTVDRQTLTLDTPSVGLATMNQFFFPNNHFPCLGYTHRYYHDFLHFSSYSLPLLLVLSN